MKFFHLAISPCTNPEGEKNGEEEKKRKENWFTNERKEIMDEKLH